MSAAGTDVTAITALLTTAQTDIADASTTIQSFANYTLPAPTDATTSTPVDTSGLRQMVSSMSTALKTAHDALEAVVQAIIQSMNTSGTASSTAGTSN